MIQSISQPNSKPVQAGATHSVISGPTGLPSGIARPERAWQQTGLQESTMRLFSPMLHCTNLGYIDHNLIKRRSTIESGMQKV